MIRDTDRKLAALLVRLRIWRLERTMWVPQLYASRGTWWLWNWMRARQAPEDRPYHHAPACPANRWAGQALVLQRCNCGAVKRFVETTYSPMRGVK